MLAAAAPLMLFHVMPLRIDHHGWQTMLGLFAIAACFDPRASRGGLIAGAASASWLAISLEGLPMVTAIAALLGLRFVIGDRDDAARLRGFAAALALGGLTLFAAFHGPAAYARPWCDAVSPAWFGPLALAPGCAALLVPLAAREGRVARIAVLVGVAAAGIACLPRPHRTACTDPLRRSIRSCGMFGTTMSSKGFRCGSSPQATR